MPGRLTPRLQEQLVRLGTWMPFNRAAVLFSDFTRVAVNEDYARRHTEKTGAAYVEIQTAEVDRLEQETPPPPPGVDKLCLSADGAMVPIVGGEWTEVKTLMVGEVLPPVMEKGEAVVHLQNISYFSRLADNHTFERLALVETQRRGVETARQAGAVLDGAEWLQGFADFHRRDALRILDFSHGASYVSQIGQGVYGEGTAEGQGWLTAQLHCLKHAGAQPVMAELRALTTARPDNGDMAEALAYLEKRVDQMDYPRFQAAGWPIGSGAVESGNKLVVEARLKGSGMHWARAHVDPMLGLRNIVCNDRWDEAWPLIEAYQRQQAAHASAERRRKRQAAQVNAKPPEEALPVPYQPVVVADAKPAQSSSKAAEPYRPASNHPWRRMPIGRAQRQPVSKACEASKL